MQESGGAGHGPAAGERVPGLSPVRAFLLLGAVATVVPLTILATRPEAAPSAPPATSSPDFSLTDAEAIARFQELHQLFRVASKTRDVTLLRTMLVPNSPLVDTAHDEIRQLIEDAVLDRSEFKTLRLRVLENSATRIVVEQVVRIHPRFIADQTRRDVSAGPPLRQRVEWTLMLEGSIWKVYDSVVTSSEKT